MDRYRLVAQWPPNRRDAQQDAALIASAAMEVAAIEPRLGRLERVDRRGQRQPLKGRPEWERAVLDRVREGELPGGIRTIGARVEAIVFGRYDVHLAELRGAVGIQLQGAEDGFWVPNRVELNLDASGVRREQLEAMLRVLVRTFDPLWAFAGTERHPATAPDGAGEPVPGWLTYLSRPCGRPPPLEPPVHIEVIDTRGWMIRCFDGLPDETSDVYFEATDALALTLAEAGSLRSYAEVLRDPRTEEVRGAGRAREDDIPVPAPAPAPEFRPQPYAQVAAPTPAPIAMPRRVAALDSTSSGAAPPARPVLPFDSTSSGAAPPARPVLPFAEAAASTQPPASAPTRSAPRVERENLPMGETAPIGAKLPKLPPMPFVPAASRATSGPPGGELTLNQFAAVFAKLGLPGADRASVLAEHGIESEAVFARIQSSFEARFQEDPSMHGKWAALVGKLRALLLRG